MRCDKGGTWLYMDVSQTVRSTLLYYMRDNIIFPLSSHVAAVDMKYVCLGIFVDGRDCCLFSELNSNAVVLATYPQILQNDSEYVRHLSSEQDKSVAILSGPMKG